MGRKEKKKGEAVAALQILSWDVEEAGGGLESVSGDFRSSRK